MSLIFFPLDWQALNPETLECSALSFKVMNTQNLTTLLFIRVKSYSYVPNVWAG